jgi:hypothetical protein
MHATWSDFTPVSALRVAVKQLAPNDTTSDVGKAAKALATTLDSIAGDSLVDARQVWDAPPDVWTFADLNGEFGLQLTNQDSADQMPTRAALAVARSRCAELAKLVARWLTFVQRDLAAFNQVLTRQGKTPLAVQVGPARRCAP